MMTFPLAHSRIARSRISTGATAGVLLALSACVSAPQHRPAPAPQPVPQPAPPPAPVAKDWRDWPVAKGDWTYQRGKDGSIAAFGEPGKTMQLVFRCDVATHRIHMLRTTTHKPQPGSQMTIYTSYGSAQWPISLQSNVEDGYIASIRASNDRVLDQIAFTRGRFAVAVPGTAPLVVPGWAEVNRVIEDCRG